MHDWDEVQQIINTNTPAEAITRLRNFDQSIADEVARLLNLRRRTGERIETLRVLAGDPSPERIINDARHHKPSIRELRERLVEILTVETDFLSPQAIHDRCPEFRYGRVYQAIFVGSRRNPCLTDDPRFEVTGDKGARLIRMRAEARAAPEGHRPPARSGTTG